MRQPAEVTRAASCNCEGGFPGLEQKDSRGLESRQPAWKKVHASDRQFSKRLLRSAEFGELRGR